jgi:hypothetical protein
LGEPDHGKAVSYRSNRGFVITQSNFKRFFVVQEVNIPRPATIRAKPTIAIT